MCYKKVLWLVVLRCSSVESAAVGEQMPDYQFRDLTGSWLETRN